MTPTPTLITTSILINTGAGDDTLAVSGVSTQTLTITDKLGNNTITVGSGDPLGGSANVASTVGGNLLVTTGVGNDIVNIAGVIVGGKTTLNVGRGSNTGIINGGPSGPGGHADVNSIFGSDLRYIGGKGNDTVFIGNPVAGVNDGKVIFGRLSVIDLGKGGVNSLNVNILAARGVSNVRNR